MQLGFPPFIKLTNPEPLFTCHWYCNDEPVALTTNDADALSQTVSEDGLDRILGAVKIVSGTASLVSKMPQLLEMMQKYLRIL